MDVCSPLNGRVFPYWMMLSEDLWHTKFHKWLILVMQVSERYKGGLKLDKRQNFSTSASFQRFFPSLSCSSQKFFILKEWQLRPDWSYHLGRSNRIWKIQQVHLQAKLHNLTNENDCIFFNCILKSFCSYLTFEYGKIEKCGGLKNFQATCQIFTAALGLVLSFSASFGL